MDPATIAVGEQSPWKSLKELVEYGRKNPGKLKSGITAGAATHVFEASFAKAARIKFTSVPFTSGGRRIPALLGGHVDCNFEIVGPLRSLADAGRVRILAVASDERIPLYPDIPTAKEQGVNWVIWSWHGVFSPKGTPADRINFVDSALEKTAHNPGFVKLMNKSSLQVKYLNSKGFKAFFKEQDQLFEQIIRDLGLYKRPER
jgi:tripartite-type tricarboxylate transporter receptor subunit TctC